MSPGWWPAASGSGHGREWHRSAPELGGRAAGRGSPQVVQREQNLAVPVKQALDPKLLFIGQTAGKDSPEAPIGTKADSSNEAFERRGAGQKDLVGSQPGRRTVEEEARVVIAGPGERVEPARQSEPRHSIFREVAKTVAVADQGDMAPSLASVPVSREIDDLVFAELTRNLEDHSARHLREIVEEYAEKADEETPRRFSFDGRTSEVAEVLDAWLAPDHRYFKVRGDNAPATFCETMC